MMSMYGSLRCWSISLEIEEENVGVFETVQKHWHRPSGKIRHNLAMSIFLPHSYIFEWFNSYWYSRGVGEAL